MIWIAMQCFSGTASNPLKRRTDIRQLLHVGRTDPEHIGDICRQMAETITDVFWIRSPDMKELHYVSPSFERIWGRPAESLYANPHQWTDLSFPRIATAFRPPLPSSQATHQAWTSSIASSGL